MQKIAVFILLFSLCIMVYAQEIRNEKDVRITQLTQDAKLTDLVESSDGKWIAFVKKSNYVVPGNCFYFFQKGEQAQEIWIVNTSDMTKKLLVAPHFTCKDASQVILDPHNLQFSPDNKTIFFETSAWVTSGAIHAIDIDGRHLRFVTDGSELRVVQSGLNKGDMIVNQHRYHFKDDMPLGSDDEEWLLTPEGKQINQKF